MIRDIRCSELIRLLDASPADELGMRARRIASTFDPDSVVTVATQPAARTAETLRVKYSLASERGATVLGLDRLVHALTRLGAARIAGCHVEAPGQFALVFFTEDASELVGVLHVVSLAGGASEDAAR
jgi:hypothetical protein